MFKELLAKLKDSFLSILPIFGLVIFLHFTIVPLSNDMIGDFLIGSLFLMLGMSFFTLGADNAMMPMGNKIGAYISKHKKLGFLIIITLLLGTFITLAEPDLKVLADQASYLPSTTLIVTVSVGVGLFLALAALRIIFKLNLSKLLVISYGIVFVITIFTKDKFIPLSFDSGGVITHFESDGKIDKVYYIGDNIHTLIVGSSGSGKSRSVIIPTITLLRTSSVKICLYLM